MTDTTQPHPEPAACRVRFPTRTKTMCDCIKRIDDQLAARNACLPVGINFTTGGCDLLLRLDKVDSKKKIGSAFIVATHCPFCGIKAPAPATPGESA